ncbi:hypothetical protein [Thermomonospora umbrina]|uniref:SnoaL-like protein n=1 Tax=Thermomonospora umbrina TaxID=111806 RepID=A0A3D9T3U5_9ACTN|nr:hypothetical protein [Thermomonospora umbrina]REE98481.1 hypothetical protein DFJ69_3970 [Thermomonospora umbrina]
MRPFALGLILSAVPALGACGAFDEPDEPGIPPLVWESGDPRLTDPRPVTASAAETREARVVLYRYLRGLAAGDVRICALITPEYEESVFEGPRRCRGRLGTVRERLGARNLAALRGVTVPVARPGPGPGRFTVRFTDLRWRTGRAAPGGPLAERFVLRRVDDRWLIVA